MGQQYRLTLMGKIDQLIKDLAYPQPALFNKPTAELETLELHLKQEQERRTI